LGSDYALNFSDKELFSFDALGSIFASIFMPLCLAFAGKKERNRRAVLADFAKGLKTV
jgi:hypothetical protein